MTTQKTNKYMHGRNINKQIIKTEQARHMTESLGTRLELLSFLSIIIKITDRVSHKTQLIILQKQLHENNGLLNPSTRFIIFLVPATHEIKGAGCGSHYL